MTHAKIANVAALLLVAAISLTAKDAVAQFPPNQSQAAAFTGAWCAQGDPTKHASISSNGAFLTLTNENGDTSPGQFQGQTGIVAPGWQFTTGTLSPGRQPNQLVERVVLGKVQLGRRRRRRRASSAKPDWDVVCPGRSLQVLLHPAAWQQSSVEQRIGRQRKRTDQRKTHPDEHLEWEHYWGNGQHERQPHQLG